jgi:acetyltransferase
MTRATEASPSRQDKHSGIEALLRPRSIAVIGASAQRVTLGNTVLRNFQRWPFAGPVYVVHPTARSVEGFATVPSVTQLPRGIDVAMVCVPAPAVADVLVQLEEVGCRAAIAVAAGFTPEEDRRLRGVLDRTRLAVCGPNNMGVINATDQLALYTARFRDPLPVGGVALVAQSGSGAIALVNTPGLAFSKVITSGNEYSLRASDYLRWLAQDPATTAAGVMMEALVDGDDFADAAATFARAGKRLVVLKVGRTESGAAAAQAHTGALLSSWDAYAAFFRRERIAVAADYDELASTLQCFQWPDLPRPRGRRLFVIAISGGEGALACDVASELGVPLSRLTDATQAELRRLLPGARPDNPIDFGASVGRSAAAQEQAIRAVLADPGVDMALVLQDAQHTLPIHDAHDYVQYLTVLRQALAGCDKPVVVASTTSTDTHPRLEQVLQGMPVPLLRGVREAVVALVNLAVAAEGEARAARSLAPRAPFTPALIPPAPGPWDPAATEELLVRYGIPHVRRVVVPGAEAAVEAAQALGYPLVVKVVSRQIPHRSDVGGVVVGVESPDELRAAVARIAASIRERAPAAEIQGYELQPEIRGGIEAIVGFKADPAFRGLVTVGLGGVFVELFRQYAAALVPLSQAEAAQLIDATPLGRIMAGYRGQVPVTPTESLARIVAALSRLGAEQSAVIAEVDLNPVLIRPGSGEAVVVDALVVGQAPDRRPPSAERSLR